MTYLIVLAVIVLAPVIAIVLLNVNAAIAFMSLCVGSVLVNYTTPDVTSVVTSFSASKHILTANQWVQLGLLVAPFILTILFTIGSVHGSKRFTNVLPAAATGLLFALLVIPLLSSSLQHQIHDQHAWQQLSNAQTAVVLGGAFFSLVFLLTTHRGGYESKKHAKH